MCFLCTTCVSGATHRRCFRCQIPQTWDGCRIDSDLEDDDETASTTTTRIGRTGSTITSTDFESIFSSNDSSDGTSSGTPESELALASDGSSDSTNSLWTVYTETYDDGPKCFLPGTCFIKADETIGMVHALCRGDQVLGPERIATVDNIIHHQRNSRIVAHLSLGMVATQLTVETKVTYDHRMLLPNSGYRRAHDLEIGDMVCTSEGDLPVVSVMLEEIETETFEVTFASDRPIYMFAAFGIAGAFGAVQTVPYHASCYIEFRFKGPICSSMRSAESWLNQDAFQALLHEFEMQFWASRAFAVWVTRDVADAFWEVVTRLLRNAPKGSKIRRQPPQLFIEPPPAGISTPPVLTP